MPKERVFCWEGFPKYGRIMSKDFFRSNLRRSWCTNLSRIWVAAANHLFQSLQSPEFWIASRWSGWSRLTIRSQKLVTTITTSREAVIIIFRLCSPYPLFGKIVGAILFLWPELLFLVGEIKVCLVNIKTSKFCSLLKKTSWLAVVCSKLAPESVRLTRLQLALWWIVFLPKGESSSYSSTHVYQQWYV